LITIGELSKLTNVNAKSLRYYEEIGVLPPAYIDTNNAYRYYSYAQISQVYSIQFFVKMGIPLCTLKNFINAESGAINYKEQILYGIDIARENMQMIENRIRFSKYLISELERGERIVNSTAPVKEELPAKTCRTLPITGKLSEQKYYRTLKRLLLDMRKADIAKGSETGLLYLTDSGKRKCYVFSDIQDLPAEDAENIVHIPAQVYLSIKTPFVDIEADNCAISASLTTGSEGGGPKVIILSELFVSDFDYRNRIFELRWAE